MPLAPCQINAFYLYLVKISFSKTSFFQYLNNTFIIPNYAYIITVEMSYMCKSTKICDETLKVLLKIFFRAHLRGQVFLVVCSIYKRNSWLNRVHRIVYFFQNNFLLFKKMPKKAFLFKPQPFSPETIYSKFHKRN